MQRRSNPIFPQSGLKIENRIATRTKTETIALFHRPLFSFFFYNFLTNFFRRLFNTSSSGQRLARRKEQDRAYTFQLRDPHCRLISSVSNFHACLSLVNIHRCRERSGCIKKRFPRKYLEPVNDGKNNGRNVQRYVHVVAAFLSPSFSLCRDFENTFDEELFFGGGSTRGEEGERESYGRLVTTFLMAVRLVFKRLSAQLEKFS